MRINFLHWEPSISEPAGHVALSIGGKTYGFWGLNARPDDTRGPTPGVINTDENLEKFIAGLRKAALSALQEKGLRLPSGIQVYSIIFEHFEHIKTASEEALSKFFTEIDPDQKILGDQRDTVVEASKALTRWLQETNLSKADITNIGNPSDTLDISFLDGNAITSRLGTLQSLALDNKLFWYAKVGAATDNFLNNEGEMKIAGQFPEQTGFRYYVRGKVRHNCASFILDALKEGGLENYTKNFSEKPYIKAALQQTMTLNADSKGELPDTKQLASVNSIEHLNMPFRLFGYGNSPITNWFGTTPVVLYRLVLYAINASKQPTKGSTQNCLVA